MVKCDVEDNNMCEIFDGVLLEARNEPIISLAEDIRQNIMNRIVTKRTYAMKWKFGCGPNIVKNFEK